MQMRCPGCLQNGNPVPFDASCLNLNRKIMRKSARPAIRNNTSSNSNSNSNSNSASDSNSNNSTKPRTTTAEFQGVFPYIVNLCRQFWFVSATNFFFCDLFPVRRRCQRCVFTCNHYHPPEETEVTSYLIQKLSPPPCFSQESFKFVSLLRLRPTKTRAARSEILGAEGGACCRGLWILWGGCGKIWHLRVRTMILLLVKQERMFRNLEIPVSGACWIEETVTSETSKLWALAKKRRFSMSTSISSIWQYQHILYCHDHFSKRPQFWPGSFPEVAILGNKADGKYPGDLLSKWTPPPTRIQKETQGKNILQNQNVRILYFFATSWPKVLQGLERCRCALPFVPKAWYMRPVAWELVAWCCMRTAPHFAIVPRFSGFTLSSILATKSLAVMNQMKSKNSFQFNPMGNRYPFHSEV